MDNSSANPNPNPNPNPSPNPKSDVSHPLHRLSSIHQPANEPKLNPNPNPDSILNLISSHNPNPNSDPHHIINPCHEVISQPHTKSNNLNTNHEILSDRDPGPITNSPIPNHPSTISDSNPNPDVSRLLQRLSSLERSVQQLLLSDKKKQRSSEHHILQNLEQQMEASSSPRIPRGQQKKPSKQSILPYPSTLGRNHHSNSKPRTNICVFQMPLHYPRYSKNDYEAMPEWKIDLLLQEYGLPIDSSLSAKRNLAIGNFLWK